MASRSLAQETGHPVLDRIGIHVGEVWIDENAASIQQKELSGIQVDTAARIAALGGADQISMGRFVFDSARQVLKGEDLTAFDPLLWLNHGPYAMKGVEEPLNVCEVGEEGKAALTVPRDSEKAHRFIASGTEPILGWRPAVGQTVRGTSWVLEEKLGEGGFGEVWLGRDKILKSQHVFKFCFRADRVRSFKREVTLFRLLRERIGQIVSEEALAGITRFGFTKTVVESSSRSGTQLYMAPELLAGNPASIRSDIYALGVVIFQLLDGDFTQPVTTDWTRRIADPLLREDLEKCFAGDPRERFASAAQFAAQLRSVEERRGELARRQLEEAAIREQHANRERPRRTRRLVAISGAIAASGRATVHEISQSLEAAPS